MNKSRDVSYTLTAMATLPFTLYPAPWPPTHRIEVCGAWTELTCGGAPIHATFYTTPQYRLVVSGSAALAVHIQLTYPKEVSASLLLLRGGERVSAAAPGDIVHSSGPYRQGYCLLEGALSPGLYSLVLSTYRAGDMLGRYSLVVRADGQRIALAEIAAEGQSGYRATVRGAWAAADGSAAGCSNHGRYQHNPAWSFDLPAASHFSARLQAVQPPQQLYPQINLSLFSGPAWRAAILAGKPLRPAAAACSSEDGVYLDGPTGVYVSSARKGALPAGNWVLVASCFDPIETDFTVYLSYSLTSPIVLQRVSGDSVGP